MMFLWKPEFTRTCIQSYVIGRIQYGAALYWLRATTQSIDKVRYDYIQAMASALGLTTPEVLGLARCSVRPTVKEDNKQYLKLCRILDLPTLRDMAIRSAGRLLTQWVEFESSLFTENADGKVCATSAPLGSLASDLVELSNQEVRDWYPQYHKLKTASSKEKRTEIPPECRPEWQQQWSGATRDTETVFARHGAQKPRQLDIMNSYWLMSRYKFRVMEKLDRVKKRLFEQTRKKGAD